MDGFWFGPVYTGTHSPVSDIPLCDPDVLNQKLTKQFTQLIDQSFESFKVKLWKDPSCQHQLRLWLFQSLGNMSDILSDKSFHRLFSQFFSNEQFQQQLVKEILQLYSDYVIRSLKRYPELFQKFFKGSRTRSEGWFQHFHYNGDMQYGARAIERYTFNHRHEYWNTLVWTKNDITPVVATARRGLYMQLNVYKTVQNLVNIHSFWNSDEFIQSIEGKEGGSLLSLQYDYWKDEVIKILNAGRDKSFIANFHELLDMYLDSRPFTELCKRFLNELNDEELLDFFQRVNKNCTKLFNNHIPTSDMFYYLVRFPTWTSLSEFSLVNAMLLHTTSFSAVFREQEFTSTSVDIDIIITNLLTCLDSIKELTDISKIATLASNRLLAKRYIEYTLQLSGLDNIQFVLRQISICSFCLYTQLKSLVSKIHDHLDEQSLLDKFGITYTPAYQEALEDIVVGKKRKRKSSSSSNSSRHRKDRHRDDEDEDDEPVIIGWYLDSFHEPDKTFQYSKRDLPLYLTTVTTRESLFQYFKHSYASLVSIHK